MNNFEKDFIKNKTIAIELLKRKGIFDSKEIKINKKKLASKSWTSHH